MSLLNAAPAALASGDAVPEPARPAPAAVA
jgi:hypothetical protein